MRTGFAITLVIFALSLAAQTGPAPAAPEQFFERGLQHYRAARYTEAVTDLNEATLGFLSPAAMQAYVSSGKFPRLQQLETALIHLALAHTHLGNEGEAREAVLRLVTAEKIEPVYSGLPLGVEAGQFETIASRLVPGLSLGAGAQLAQGGTPAPGPATVAAAEPARAQLAEQMVAQECARIQREADEKIAATIRAADERVAAAERAASARIAAIERAADLRVAEAEAGARRAAEQRRAAVQPAPSPVPPPRAPAAVAAPAETWTRSEWRDALRRAHEFAAAGRLAEASEIYARIGASSAARELRAEAATGLYRTRAYRDAVEAFHRVVPFARGEEDLRYYNAVSLYEIGRYADARNELVCALPYIRQTDDVLRYRMMIEQMVMWRAAQPVQSASQ